MNPRDTQFIGYANALHKELVEIHHEGYTNNWNSVDIDRRVIQAIARRAYDLALHVADHVSEGQDARMEAGFTNPVDVVEIMPDMTELPREQER